MYVGINALRLSQQISPCWDVTAIQLDFFVNIRMFICLGGLTKTLFMGRSRPIIMWWISSLSTSLVFTASFGGSPLSFIFCSSTRAIM